MLNRLWLGFFLTATVAALAQWLVGGNAGVFAAMVASLFDMAKLSVDVMILLFGTLTLWLGFLRIAERAGLIDLLARALGPLFARLMPEVPRGHPAVGLITLNFAANALGLDNAATPIGLRAMRELQTLNPSDDHREQRADPVPGPQRLVADPAAGVDLHVPRAAGRARSDPGVRADPARDQRLDADRPAHGRASCRSSSCAIRSCWRGCGATALLLAGFIAFLASLSALALASLSSLLGNLSLFGIILAFLVAGAWRKVPVYESFIDGAKQGFEVARDLLPYLVAMLCAIGVLRASGALDFALDGIRWFVERVGWDTRFVDALPTALVKPFSGSAARAMLIETMQSARRRQFPGAARGDHAGQYRNHVLRARGLFRRGRHPARAPRGRLRVARRPRRRGRLDRWSATGFLADRRRVLSQ